MKVVDNSTTRRDNKIIEQPPLFTTKSMSIKNCINKTKLLQIKPKQNNIIETSLKKCGTCPQCDLLTGRQTRSTEFKNTFPFLNNIVIRYQLKSLKCSSISP